MLAEALESSCDYIIYGVEKSGVKVEMDYILKQFPDEKIVELVKIFNAICQLTVFDVDMLINFWLRRKKLKML